MRHSYCNGMPLYDVNQSLTVAQLSNNLCLRVDLVMMNAIQIVYYVR